MNRKTDVRLVFVTIKCLDLEDAGKKDLEWFQVLAWLITGKSLHWDKEQRRKILERKISILVLVEKSGVFLNNMLNDLYLSLNFHNTPKRYHNPFYRGRKGSS